MLVPLFMTVSLLSCAKQARHQVQPPAPDRQVCGRLGGQTRPRPLARALSRSPLASPKTENRAVVPTRTNPPKLFVLMPLPASLQPIPAQPAPALPHPLMPLASPLRLTLQTTEVQEEEELAGAINHERTRLGLGSLTLDPLLSVAARAHSREMRDRHYFDHQSPESGQQTPLDRYLAARREAGESRPSRIAVGENIFYASQTDSQYNAGFAHQALMASPEHRENILAPRFTKVGIGLCRDQSGQFWVTEMFLQDN